MEIRLVFLIWAVICSLTSRFMKIVWSMWWRWEFFEKVEFFIPLCQKTLQKKDMNLFLWESQPIEVDLGKFVCECVAQWRWSRKNKGAVQRTNPFLERHLFAVFRLVCTSTQSGDLSRIAMKDLGAGGVLCATRRTGCGARLWSKNICGCYSRGGKITSGCGDSVCGNTRTFLFCRSARFDSSVSWTL